MEVQIRYRNFAYHSQDLSCFNALNLNASLDYCIYCFKKKLYIICYFFIDQFTSTKKVIRVFKFYLFFNAYTKGIQPMDKLYLGRKQ